MGHNGICLSHKSKMNCCWVVAEDVFCAVFPVCTMSEKVFRTQCHLGFYCYFNLQDTYFC